MPTQTNDNLMMGTVNLNPTVVPQTTTNTITSDSLKATNPVPLANPNVDPNLYTGKINSVVSDLTNSVNTAQQNVNNLNSQGLSDTKAISDLQVLLGNKVADTNQIYNEKGVTDLYNQLSDLNAQATGLKNEALAIPIQVQNEFAGRGATDAGVQPIETARLRNNALKALSLGQQAAIASANYDKAKNYADQIIETKYAGITAQIEAKKTNLQALKDFQLTPAQNKLLQEQEKQTKYQEQQLADLKANEKTIQDALITASSQGAPSDVVTKARELANKGAKPEEVVASLGAWAGDYYHTQLLKEQIATEKAQRAKIYQSMQADNIISNLGANPGQITAPNGDAVKMPDNITGAISKLKLNEGQANAVAFVARMIQSDKSINDLIKYDSKTQSVGGYNPTTVGASIGGAVYSDNSREYTRQYEDFIRAQLRKESGALISDDELAGGRKLYVAEGIMQNEKDIASTAQKRDQAIRSMITQAGPAAAYLQQYYNQVKTLPVLPATQPNNPFMTALGKTANTTIQGTSIISNISKDGINFNIPTK